MPFAVRVSPGLKVFVPLLLLAYGFGSSDRSLGNWIESACCVGLLVVSVAAHEFGHVVLVRRHGLTLEQVTLTAFGGLTHYEGTPPSPLAEAMIAFAGPLASALLAMGLLAARIGVGGSDVDGVASVLTFGVATNVMITIVNLIPLPTLDGGRLTGSLWRAIAHKRGVT